MSGICGYFVRHGRPPADSTLDLMLAAIEYRGDKIDAARSAGVALGYRWWGGRPGKAPGIHADAGRLAACAGSLAPPTPNPAVDLLRLANAAFPAGLAELDGAFAGACWDPAKATLTLLRDPFGVRSLYYVEHEGVFFFASELKQLLALPNLPVEVNSSVLHKYLTFSFVPGEEVPIAGIRRLLPGHVLVVTADTLSAKPYFTLKENIDPAFNQKGVAGRAVRAACESAVRNRLNGEAEVGLYLSGGLDSSGVASWLSQSGAKTRAFTLDFGVHSVELEQARSVATALGIELHEVRASGDDIAPLLMDLVWKLDLPFGDPVTGPHYLLAQAARGTGLSAVFNGEGGDQFFGGWTNKPMVAASMYAGLYEDETREEMYLKSYHRFYGLEDDLYTPEFREMVGGPGQRRAHLIPYLHSDQQSTFLNRIRMADIALKGSQNILPRAERISNAWALDVRVPLFDRALAELSFRLPPQLKLHGATEKYILKRILQRDLPKDVVWRRKYGMSVPITQWILESRLGDIVRDLLSPASLARRGLFQTAYVERMLRGENDPHETRRRRIGERLWCLAMLEAWLRVFVDGRGRKPT